MTSSSGRNIVTPTRTTGPATARQRDRRRIDPSNPLQITFDLAPTYGSYFFTYNELSQITPLPSTSGTRSRPPVRSGTALSETRPAVYKFLDAQSKSISTYDTNPLWQVVSGPWKLKSMDTAGDVSMVPNPGYGGPIKPTLTQFNEVPFTQAGAEFDPLKSATSVTNAAVDYGYLPTNDALQKSSLNSTYDFEPWIGWQVLFFPENFTNPISGPVFKQYFRQAMQDLISAPEHLITTEYLATPTRPVWTKPSSTWKIRSREAIRTRTTPSKAKSAPGQRMDGRGRRGEHMHEPRHGARPVPAPAFLRAPGPR